MNILKKWTLGRKGTFGNEKLYFSGKVYGHPSFEMGASINTSRISKIIPMEDFYAVETGSGSQYIIFKDDIDPVFLRENPNFFTYLAEYADVLKSRG